MKKKVGKVECKNKIFVISGLVIFLFLSPTVLGATEIETWYDLDAVRTELGEEHKLVTDLDEDTAGYQDVVDTEDGWKPIGSDGNDHYEGYFYGQGHEIRDLYINRTDEERAGLFQNINWDGTMSSSGLVQNLTIEGEVHGDYQVGMLAGRLGGEANINDITVKGKVTGDESVGGVTGYGWDGSYNRIKADVHVIGNYEVGGLVGDNHRSGSSFRDSYVMGKIEGGDKVGGAMGGSTISEWKMERVYSVANVTGDSHVGGLVGYNDDDAGEALYSFWDINASGQEESASGFGRTTEEMKDIDTFEGAGWDIEHTQEYDPTDGYPFLSHEVEGSPTWYIYETDPEPDEYTVSLVDIIGEGSVEADIVGDGVETLDSETDSFLVDDGTDVEFSPDPDEGWVWDEWTEDASGETEIFTKTITEDYDIGVAFEEEEIPVDPNIEVETLSATNVDNTSATIWGELTELEEIDEADLYLYWRKEDEPDWNEEFVETSTSPTTFTHDLENLDNQTTYEFYAYGEGEHEGVTYSDEGDVETFFTEEVDVDILPTFGDWIGMVPYLGFIVSPVVLYLGLFIFTAIVTTIVAYYIGPTISIFTAVSLVAIYGVFGWLPTWLALIIGLAIFGLASTLGGRGDER